MDSNNINNNPQDPNVNPYTQSVKVTPPVQPAYQMPPQPAPAPQPQKPQENKKLELLLCFLSLGLYIGGPMVSGIFVYLAGGISTITSGSTSDVANSIGEVFTSILSMVGSASYIGAWVLMIIARVKFKKSVFAKVLMWVYIGLLVLSVVAVVVVVVSCINALRDCPG